jgi:prophage antirepressor-like protein
VDAASGQPLFVGKDVCDVLGYVNHNDAMSKHCKGVAIRYPIPDSLNRIRETRVLPEPDVLRLIVKSTLPDAERFERWVFETVLPTIRRTGAYSATPAIPQTLAQALRLAADQAERIEAQQLQIAEQAVSVDALNRLAGTDGLLTPRDAAKAIGVSPTALNRWLDAHGWTYVQGGRRHAYQRRIESGDLAQKVHEVGPEDDRKSVVQVYVTMAGAAKLAKRVKS